MRTRFAPSPSGYLHIGHAYAADQAFCWAQKNGGECLLRIEDVDQTRCKAELIEAIIEDLQWLGFDWPKPILIQSQNREKHWKVLYRLLQKGLIYPCLLSRTEHKALLGKEKTKPVEDIQYIKDAWATYRKSHLNPQPLPRTETDLLGFNWRLSLHAVLDQNPHFYAGLKQILVEKLKPASLPKAVETYLEDIILWRKDGSVSYHLACIVDDHLQNITHIIRGEDLLTSTPVQVTLQKLLDFKTPHYKHHRLLLDDAGKKFSKRDHARYLRSYRATGITPTGLQKKYSKFMLASNSNAC